ncbi:histone deacetylase [Kitasatospora sp. NPDC006697]|uniref:histone deacetylase n=1 Tax=Kitasatospora sp. NPDC006697 TaxID=3364020 RepID=UPI00369D2EDE
MLWYAAYGSNMARARFACYVQGGRPPGGAREYPGCRDGRMPEADRAVTLAGRLFFAGVSQVWGGGRAFFEAGGGEVPARAYRVTAGQFADVAAQEMYREPGGAELDLAEVLARGRVVLGPGRYETLVLAGWVAGEPMVTFTSPWGADGAELNAPSAAYLRQLAAGLREAHGWGRERIAGYLAARPGAAGLWSAEAVARVLV